MGERTLISWCDHTFNPWLGCMRIGPSGSSACDGCYAAHMMGGAVGLARVLSPDNTVARRLPATRHMVCQPCLLEHEGLALLLEVSDG